MGERKEYRGEFWLASHPSHRVAGTLTFHPKRQGELRLNQSLEPGLAHDRQEWDRIMGDVLGY